MAWYSPARKRCLRGWKWPEIGAISGKKALRVFGRFEFPHFLLSQSRGLVRVLSSIIEKLVLAMLYSRQEFAFRRSITLEFISDNHAGNVLQLFKELAEKSLGGFLVAAALDQDIEHIAVLIYRSPEIMGLPIDFEKDLVQMPFVATTRASSPQFVGIGLPKCEAPLPD